MQENPNIASVFIPSDYTRLEYLPFDFRGDYEDLVTVPAEVGTYFEANGDRK